MGWGENDRGVSFTFGAEVAAKFLHKHDFDLICRAHQVIKPISHLVTWNCAKNVVTRNKSVIERISCAMNNE